MTYATLADMQARFETDELIQLTDQNLTGAIGEVAVATVLTEADNLINSYLAKRYSPLPLVTVPTILVDKACDIARYRLYKTEPASHVTTRYKEALAWLKDVANGTVVLDVGGVEVPSTGASVEFGQMNHTFTRQSMRGF